VAAVDDGTGFPRSRSATTPGHDTYG